MLFADLVADLGGFCCTGFFILGAILCAFGYVVSELTKQAVNTAGTVLDSEFVKVVVDVLVDECGDEIVNKIIGN